MTSHQRPENLTLITGGTGKTGRRIADRLTARGWPMRIGSRAGSPAFDWDEPAGWAAALQGVHATYLSYYPDLAVPGAASTVAAFVAHLTDGVFRALGRAPRDFRDYARTVAATGAWRPLPTVPTVPVVTPR
ncbi:MAG TPA: hypothetical protein VIJ00_03685 [Nakamurella sp.]